MKRWEEIAEELPIGTKTRIRCCGTNKDAIISNDIKGHSYFCFKCGTRIFNSVGTRHLSEILDLHKLNEKELSPELPEDFIPTIPVQHACWLYKAGLDVDAIMEAGIGWSDSLQRIVIPVRDDNGTLLYFQCRAVHKGQIPKYKNPPISKSSLLYKFGWSGDRSRIVVTEDILSCIRVGKHLPACSILGTKTSDEQAGILSEYDMVSYWLDPDEAGRKGSIEGVSKVGLATNTEVLTSHKDPKHLSDRVIRQILKLPAQEDYIYHGCLTPTDNEAQNTL